MPDSDRREEEMERSNGEDSSSANRSSEKPSVIAANSQVEPSTSSSSSADCSGNRQRTKNTEESTNGVEGDEDCQPKRQKTLATDVPGGGGRSIPQTPVPQSPLQFVSLEEIMNAAEGMKNMALAHEIALDSNFRLEEPEAPPEDSLMSRVSQMMNKAFWDLLEQELQEDPPCYAQAMNLLKEVKESLLELLPKRNSSFRTDIENKLDLDLIRQQADAGTLEFQSYAQYIIYMMGKMCCPARDENVKALSQLEGVVSTFKGILESLKKMKLDYANFTLHEARPLIIANSVAYERKKFAEMCICLPNDGELLPLTRQWLIPHKVAFTTSEPTTSSQEVNPRQQETIIMTEGYLEALDWTEKYTFPETLVLDKKRFLSIGERCRLLVALTAVVNVTMPVAGPAVQDLSAFKHKLRERIQLLLPARCYDEDLKNHLPNVAAQIIKEVNECLTERGFVQLSPLTEKMLTGTILSLSSESNAIRRILHSRMLRFFAEALVVPRPVSMQLPSGFTATKDQLVSIAADLSNLVWYNRTVYGSYYTEILDLFTKTVIQSSADKTAAERGPIRM